MEHNFVISHVFILIFFSGIGFTVVVQYESFETSPSLHYNRHHHHFPELFPLLLVHPAPVHLCHTDY